jgi:CelD/BcsL family acetyltransferase involved in cellulose biosynthesis
MRALIRAVSVFCLGSYVFNWPKGSSLGVNVIDNKITDIRDPARAEWESRKMVSLRGRRGFEQLATQWERMILRMGHVRFFQHPDWYRALFDSALADPDDLLFVTISDGPDLVGLFPLQIDNFRKLGATINTIGLCNHPHMALADCLIDDSYEWSWLIPSLMRWLHEARPVIWDVLMLNKVPERSALYRLLSAEPASLVMPAITGSSAYVPTESEETALGPVSASFKRDLRRLAKRAEQTAPLRYKVCDTLPELGHAFPQFLDVEASGWKGARGIGTAIAQDTNLVSFYQELMRRFGARGQCIINQLLHGDTVVASQFGLLVGGTCNILKIGYREDHAWFAPGNLAMERTIRWCCGRPDVHEMSFVTCPSWVRRWKPRQEAVASFRIFRTTMKGRLLRSGLHTKRWYDKRRRRTTAPERSANPSPAGIPDETGIDSPGGPAASLLLVKSRKT